MLPVFPLKVKTVLLMPEQTVVAPLMLPATDTGLTEIVTDVVVANEQTPLVTTAR